MALGQRDGAPLTGVLTAGVAFGKIANNPISARIGRSRRHWSLKRGVREGNPSMVGGRWEKAFEGRPGARPVKRVSPVSYTHLFRSGFFSQGLDNFGDTIYNHKACKSETLLLQAKPCGRGGMADALDLGSSCLLYTSRCV